VIFSLSAASYVMFTGKHNQANFFGVFFGGVLFYGAPFFLLAFLKWLLKLPNHIIHSGFLGISTALFFIAGMWLLPPDPSGLPIQWMMYWPLSAILGLLMISSIIVVKKYQNLH